MSATPRVGARIVDAGTGIELVVVRPPTEDSLIIQPATARALLGKRYQCGQCSAEVIVAKAGSGVPLCHDAPMSLGQPKLLPSAD